MYTKWFITYRCFEKNKFCIEDNDSLEFFLAHFVFGSAKTQNSQTEPGAKRANLSDHQVGNLSEKLPWSEKK